MRMKACGIEIKKSSDVSTVTDPDTVDEADASEESSEVSFKLMSGRTRNLSTKILLGSLDACRSGRLLARATRVAAVKVCVREHSNLSLCLTIRTDLIDHPVAKVRPVEIWSNEREPFALSNIPLTSVSVFVNIMTSTEFSIEPLYAKMGSLNSKMASRRSPYH